jgi:hypothetical protein
LSGRATHSSQSHEPLSSCVSTTSTF